MTNERSFSYASRWHPVNVTLFTAGRCDTWPVPADLAAAVALRDVSPADQAAVRALVLAGLAERWGEVDAALNPDLDDIATAFAGGRTLVGELDGSVVATGTLLPRGGGRAEILRMSVDRNLRRHGIGRRILDELLATARRWPGVRTVVLETTSSWTDAVAFYRSYGFRPIDEADRGRGCDTWFALEL